MRPQASEPQSGHGPDVAHVFDAEGHQRLSVPGSGDKLDFNRFRGMNFNKAAIETTAHQSKLIAWINVRESSHVLRHS